MSDRTIAFLHVPKAAGATLRRQLSSAYGEARVFVFRPGQLKEDRKRLKEKPSSERLRLKVVTGHISFGFADNLLQQPLHYITILRDPVERIRSYYQFVLDTPDHPYGAAAHGKSLAEFAGGDIPGLHDLQTRMISGKDRKRLIGKDVYDLARANLARFALVGVQELYDDFVQRLAAWDDWPVIAPVGSANRASRRVDVSDAAQDIILERNRWDLALYEEAKAAWANDDAA